VIPKAASPCGVSFETPHGEVTFFTYFGILGIAVKFPCVEMGSLPGDDGLGDHPQNNPCVPMVA
jgi:hypothetical protein